MGIAVPNTPLDALGKVLVPRGGSKSWILGKIPGDSKWRRVVAAKEQEAQELPPCLQG